MGLVPCRAKQHCLRMSCQRLTPKALMLRGRGAADMVQGSRHRVMSVRQHGAQDLEQHGAGSLQGRTNDGWKGAV